MKIHKPTARKIFKKIDEIIKNSISKKPILFKDSKFKKEYEEFKKEVRW